jgi:hypothetical protein
MEQNRIQINGVWYIREDQAQENAIELDPIKFEGVVVENNEFCFEATRTRKDSYSYYDDIAIKFTDKRVKPWREDNWDSNSWMKGVLDNNPDFLKELPDIGEGTKFLQAFLQYLKDEEWL